MYVEEQLYIEIYFNVYFTCKHSINHRYYILLYTTIVTITINLIVTVTIVLLNLYVAVSTGCRILHFVWSMHFPDVAASIGSNAYRHRRLTDKEYLPQLHFLRGLSVLLTAEAANIFEY